MPKPPAAVIPLGTGNGMSVNLGWGHKASKLWVKDQKSMSDVQHSSTLSMTHELGVSKTCGCIACQDSLVPHIAHAALSCATS